METVEDIVSQYSRVSDDLQEINKKVKVIRDKRKMLEDQIMDYMEHKNITTLEVGKQKFIIKESVKTKTFSKKNLVEDLLSFMDKNQVDSITSQLFTEEDQTVQKTISHKKI